MLDRPHRCLSEHIEINPADGIRWLSPSFLTRVERDAANPTWQTIQCIAAALQAEPLLRLVAEEAAVENAAKLINRHSPMQRLLRQPVNTVLALEWLAHYAVPFVVAGSVAALLQGFPTPVESLHVLVLDNDEALEKLSEVLMAHHLLFMDVEPDELRRMVQRSWSFDDCEAPESVGGPGGGLDVADLLNGIL